MRQEQVVTVTLLWWPEPDGCAARPTHLALAARETEKYEHVGEAVRRDKRHPRRVVARQVHQRVRRELLRLLVSGMTNKDAAEQMAISVRTAEAHRAKIMLKLGADNFTEVMRLAYASGFATLSPDNGPPPVLQQA